MEAVGAFVAFLVCSTTCMLGLILAVILVGLLGGISIAKVLGLWDRFMASLRGNDYNRDTHQRR
jgi:hypothetical protein